VSATRTPRVAAAALSLSIATALTLTACGSADDAKASGITVVASTNVWGSVAEAVAGDSATVTSLIQDPSADPHSYESTPSDAAEVTDADLVVFNGGGYDEFVEKILADAGSKPTVEAFALLGAEGDLGTEDGHDHSVTEPADGHDHEHGGVNEHVWYDIPTVDAVAHKIADELSKIDPDNAAGYTERAEAFHEKLHGIADVTAKIKTDHPNSPVAQTEPIAHYLLLAAGADDVTPGEFEEAIEQGNDPSPSALAATRDLISQKQVRALVFNVQTEGKVADDVRATAETAGVPIVEVSETLPDGLDYIQWQTQNAEALAEALN